MATPKKNKSGTWTAQVYLYTDDNGKKVYKNITAQTKVECEIAIAQIKEFKQKKKRPEERTVGEICDEFLNDPVNIDRLEATTYAGYQRIRKYSFQSLMDVKIADLDKKVINKAINDESKRKNLQRGTTISPKTVLNEWGFIAGCLNRVCDVKFSKLDKPSYQPDEKFIAEPVEVLRAIVGTPVELPCLLAMWLSFTMSEIRGLTYSNIYNGLIFINKVKTVVNCADHLKPRAKNAKRKRVAVLPPYIFELIKKQEGYKNYIENGEDGFICPQSAASIYKMYTRRCAKRGVHMSFHDLRHEFATINSIELEIDEQTIIQDAGWNSTHTMKKVYIDSLERKRMEAAEKRNDYFMKLLSEV